MTLIITFINT